MEIFNKLKEDAGYLSEWVSGKTNRRYEFEGSRGPIIGIHGSFGGWTDESIKKYMAERDGLGTLLYLGLLTNNLDSYLPAIEAEVDRFKNPILIGFSIGGILALRYISKYNAWDKVKRVITVGTPFGGIPEFYSLFGSGLKEVSSKSKFLQDVVGLVPPKDKVLSIFGSGDEFIPNPQNINLNWPTVILGAISHGDLQNHSEWIQQILDAELDLI